VIPVRFIRTCNLISLMLVALKDTALARCVVLVTFLNLMFSQNRGIFYSHTIIQISINYTPSMLITFFTKDDSVSVYSYEKME